MNKIYFKKDFSNLLEHEIFRSDRTGNVFSIIFLNVSNSRLAIQSIAENIKGEIHCYDGLGLLDK